MNVAITGNAQGVSEMSLDWTFLMDAAMQLSLSVSCKGFDSRSDVFFVLVGSNWTNLNTNRPLNVSCNLYIPQPTLIIAKISKALEAAPPDHLFF